MRFRDLLWAGGLVLLLAAPVPTPAQGYTPVYTPTPCIFEPPTPDITCGTLTVPLDRDNPNGTQVELAVAILPALIPEAKAPDPVIYLEGGPGASALYNIHRWPGHPLRATRDLILYDQRGTGFSQPLLNCPEIEDGDRGALSSPLAHCRYRTLEQDAIPIEHYTSAASAADVADLAAALGYQQVNLYGISYGSRLALTVLRDHPQIVRAAVLDAVFPPEADLLADRITSRFRAFEALFGACAADPACAARYPDLEATFYAVVDRYNAEPYPITAEWVRMPSPLTGDAILTAFFLGMYSTPTLGMIPEGLALLDRAATQEDVIYGYFLVQGYLTETAYRTRDIPDEPTIREDAGVIDYEARYGRAEYAEGMYLSVNCSEELNFSDAPAAMSTDALRLPPTMIEYLRNDVRGISFGCAVWNVAEQPRSENERVLSEVPVLLIGGALDPITPVDWMVSAQAGLPNSQIAVFNYGGHGVSLDSPCGVGLVVAHINAPALDLDLSCARGEIDFYDGP